MSGLNTYDNGAKLLQTDQFCPSFGFFCFQSRLNAQPWLQRVVRTARIVAGLAHEVLALLAFFGDDRHPDALLASQKHVRCAHRDNQIHKNDHRGEVSLRDNDLHLASWSVSGMLWIGVFAKF